jgi:hypothetical protein
MYSATYNRKKLAFSFLNGHQKLVFYRWIQQRNVVYSVADILVGYETDRDTGHCVAINGHLSLAKSFLSVKCRATLGTERNLHRLANHGS